MHDGTALTDIHRPLAFGRQKQIRWVFFLALFLLLAGGFLTTVRPAKFGSSDWLMLAACFVLGISMLIYVLYRTLFPGNPALLLSPAGARLNVEWVKDILIPWREVRGIESTDVTFYLRGEPITYEDVTVLLVTRKFYDRHIHIGSSLLRGPGWDVNFIPKDKMVQVALHHEMLPVMRDDLRVAVEARWHAFRDANRTSVPPVTAIDDD